MADAEMNALVTHSMAVIIDDMIVDEMRDEIEIHEATEGSHEATETSHEATLQTKDELQSVNKGVKEWKKTSDMCIYFKINSSDNKKVVCLTCEEKVSQGGSV